MTHHPTFYPNGSHGSWATCACGWTSPTYTTTTGAHMAFGIHLIEPTQGDAS